MFINLPGNEIDALLESSKECITIKFLNKTQESFNSWGCSLQQIFIWINPLLWRSRYRIFLHFTSLLYLRTYHTAKYLIMYY